MDVKLDALQLDLIFPAHIRIGPDLTILSIGRSLRRVMPQAAPGSALLDSFRIMRPLGAVNLEAWVRSKAHLQLQAIEGPTLLRGLVLADRAGFLLCVSHVVSNMADLECSGLKMSDFSETDASIASVLAAGMQASMVAESLELIQALSTARDAALSASESKSAFLANMSHEIRTPLNGVLGVVGALSLTPLTAPQQEMIQLIMASGQTLERLLSDILDLSKVESGRLGFETAPFCLGTAIADAVRLMRIRADDKGIAFGLDLGAGTDTWLVGDVVRVKQVVANLVSNAIKFTSHGRVDVTVRVRNQHGERQEITIEVRDTGIGFDPAAHAWMFQRFAQADGSITRRFGGSGLGLAISQGLAEAMGGEIKFSSETGVGSRFALVLTLPRALASPEPELQPDDLSPRLDEATGSGRALRILLVEDNPTNQKVVCLILETQDVEITVASDGQEALSIFQQSSFDIILMDMHMPVMDGLTATRLIRAQELAESLPGTPIAMLTANTMDEHRQAAKAAGADHHITKPISPQSLILGIEATLAAAGAAL